MKLVRMITILYGIAWRELLGGEGGVETDM